MRVLVTGGGGFIGGWILRRLHDAGHSPVVFDMHDNRAKVAELLRFITSKSGYVQISLKEYIDRMKEGQNGIYYFTGESITQVSSYPFLETLRKKGLEVMYMIAPVGE